MDSVLAGYAKGSSIFVYGYAYPLFSFLSICKPRAEMKLKSKHIFYLIGLGVIAGGFGNYFGFQGIKHSAVNYGFLMKTTVIFVPILEFLF